MKKAYVVVLGLNSDNKTWMKFHSDTNAVMSTIGSLKEEHKVVRIFEVNELGKTQAMDAVFDGRLKLVYKDNENSL